MVEEKSIYQDIQDELINEYKSSRYGEDNEIRITLPINRLKSFRNGDINLDVYIDFEEFNFNKYELTILSEHNHSFKLFSSYVNKDHNDNYNILYKKNIWFDSPTEFSDYEITNLTDNNELIYTQLKLINFKKLYNYIDNLKYCNITNKLYVKPYTKEYINTYISRVDNCIICKNDTNHKIVCKCFMCIDCYYDILQKNIKKRDAVCPSCNDTNLWIY